MPCKQPSDVLDRFDGVLTTGLGLLWFGLYARTLQPGLLPGDSAEFQTLAYTLDHAHTTGYHVYLVMAKLFTFGPVGDIAYRVNLFSAFMGGLTVGLVYLAGRTLSGSRWGGALGALALAVTSALWSQAVIAEVYTAGSAVSAAVVVLVLVWQQTRRSGCLVWAGILGGMGVGVHGSVMLMAPPVLFLLLANPRALGQAWKPALGGWLIGLGLLPVAELEDWRAAIRYNVAGLPQNAVVLIGWNDLYGYAYTAQVELNRSDLLFIEAYPYSAKPGMADSLFDYLKARLAEGRPLLAQDRLDELRRSGFQLAERPIGVTRIYEINLMR